MTESSMVDASMKNYAARTVMLAAFMTLILYIVPFLHPIAYPFVLLSTLIHEMGHGVAALMVGGNFVSFNMWFDGSGVANINGDFGRFARAFVSALGLLGPALVALAFSKILNQSVGRAPCSLPLASCSPFQFCSWCVTFLALFL